MMKKSELYIGMMSGTSMDGIDTAIVEFKGNKVTPLFVNDYPIPEALKSELLSIALGQETSLREIGRLDSILGHLYADAVLTLLEKSGRKPSEISAIGNHGQTVFHQPEGENRFTIQLGDANIISARTGITTVADFRRKDMALGGQGAPLVPAFHRTIFHPDASTAVVLNIGGIANISVMQPDSPTIGYDTGPGNTLMDSWISAINGQSFDIDGRFAASGQVSTELLDELLKDEYFTRPAPKSTGREKFNMDWLSGILGTVPSDLSPQNVQATLAELTCVTIANEVIRFESGPSPELFVCGGGAHNDLLMKRLSALLPRWKVCTTDEKGVNSDYMEAVAFAWLAYRRMHGLPSNLPEATGATRPASLGVIYPAE